MKRKCLQCGGEMTTAKENHAYNDLPGVVLVGVDVHRCARCGEFHVAIPHIEQLHEALVRHLIEKATRLTGHEIRFLRGHLNLTGAALARLMGISPTTVSRWENDQSPIGTTADRLLRLIAAHGAPKASDVTMLEHVAQGTPEPVSLRVQSSDSVWTVAA